MTREALDEKYSYRIDENNDRRYIQTYWCFNCNARS